MEPNEMERWDFIYADRSMMQMKHPEGEYVRYSDAMQIITALQEKIDGMIPLADLQDPYKVQVNILRGTIAYSKLSAMHYLGITAIENWRELFGWDDETQTFDMSGMIERPNVEVLRNGEVLINGECIGRNNAVNQYLYQDTRHALGMDDAKEGDDKEWICYEIHRPHIPVHGCRTQCKECTEQQSTALGMDEAKEGGEG